jgi:hypothetical protein
MLERSTTHALDPPTPGPSNTIPTVNKKPAPTMQIPLPNFNRSDYRSFSPAKSTPSESEDSQSDANSKVSARFYTRSGHVVHPPRDWWKVDPTPEKDIQMDGFKKLSEDEPNAPVLMMDDETTLFSKLDVYGYVVDAVDEEEPKSYLEAVNGPNGDLWKEAVEKKLGSLDKARTWDVVDRVAGKKEVGSRWVFKVKRLADGSVDKFKARFHAQGLSQRPGFDFDETYAPVVQFDGFRLLLAIMAVQGWRPQQVDGKSASLYGDLDEEIFMTLPEGHWEKGKTARLRKCIYGLKQSRRKWYERLTKHFESSGFAISNFDLYVLVHKSEPFFIAVYIYDITLYGHPGPMMKHVKKALKYEFNVTDLGDLHWLLSIQIKFEKKGIELSQTAYIDTILLRFGMTDSNPTILPIDRNTTLKRSMPDEVLKDIQVFQSMIGSIMYLVTGTRPDLTFAIYLASHNFPPPPTKVMWQLLNAAFGISKEHQI